MADLLVPVHRPYSKHLRERIVLKAKVKSKKVKSQTKS